MVYGLVGVLMGAQARATLSPVVGVVGDANAPKIRVAAATSPVEKYMTSLDGDRSGCMR